jgi:hypothetical protein
MNLQDVIFVGLTGGIIYALTGFLKSISKEPFNAKKFLRTMLLGIAASFLLVLTGRDVTVDAIDIVLASGTTAVIEQLLIAIYRFAVKLISGGE